MADTGPICMDCEEEIKSTRLGLVFDDWGLAFVHKDCLEHFFGDPEVNKTPNDGIGRCFYCLEPIDPNKDWAFAVTSAGIFLEHPACADDGDTDRYRIEEELA